MTLARHVAKGLGMPAPALAEYPGLPMIDSVEDVQRKALNDIAPRIIAGLAEAAPDAEIAREPAYDEVVYTGTLEGLQDHFYERGWTDGLPVIPPTISAVERFVRYANRAPHDVIGVLPPENRKATAWNVAVNAVMAGCRPEHIPVLIAAVEAIADPEFRLEDAGATPGWEPLVIVSGPIAKALEFNCGAGVMRSGRRANTAVGRFLKLYMRNIAGIRIPPGEGDKASIGANFNVALAEDEEAAAALGWPSFAVDRGFRTGENVVTVQSVVYSTPPIYSGGDTAQEHLSLIADVFGQTSSYRAFIGIKNQKSYPLLVLGPGIARALARDGVDKDRIRKYLYDHCTMSAADVERYAWHGGHTTFTVPDLAAERPIAGTWLKSSDPLRPVPIFVKPEMIGIVVAGDPARNQSRGYVNNHMQGAPVSKAVTLPACWNALTATSTIAR